MASLLSSDTWSVRSALRKSIVMFFVAGVIVSLVSALLFAALLIIAVGHLDVSEQIQRKVFVTATILATVAQALEVVLLVPRVIRAKSTTERLVTLLALVPLLNVLVLCAVLIAYLRTQRRALRRQALERGMQAVEDGLRASAKPPAESTSVAEEVIGTVPGQVTSDTAHHAAPLLLAGIAAPTAASALKPLQ